MQKGLTDIIAQLEELKQPIILCKKHEDTPVTHIRVGKSDQQLLDPICYECYDEDNKIQKVGIKQFMKQLLMQIKNFNPKQNVQLDQLQESLNLFKNLQDLFNSLAAQMKNFQQIFKEQIQNIKNPENKLCEIGELAIKIFNSQNSYDDYQDNWKKLIPFMDCTFKKVQLDSHGNSTKSERLSTYSEILIQMENELNGFQLFCNQILEQPIIETPQEQYPTSLEYLLKNHQQMYFQNKSELKSWNYQFLVQELQQFKNEMRLNGKLNFEYDFPDQDQFIGCEFNMFSLSLGYEGERYYGHDGNFWRERDKDYKGIEYAEEFEKFNDDQYEFRDAILEVYKRCQPDW